MSVLDSLLDAPRLEEGFGSTAFDEAKHPRDWQGKFRGMVGALKVGEKVHMPSTGVEVVRSGKLTHTVRHKGTGLATNFADAGRAADFAIKKHESQLRVIAGRRAGGEPRRRSRSTGIGAMSRLAQPRRHSIASVFPR